jgi:hypothetical protein
MDGHYVVTKQDDKIPDAPKLTLVEADKWDALQPIQRFIPGIGCRPASTATPPIAVPAGSLIESGASRRGWVYGMLTMPYKYYPGLKEFETGVPIGPYLGWRVGQPGVGGTIAMAVTLSSVKAQTIDPNDKDADGKPKITGDTNVAAISGAVGYVVDVTRNPSKSPFKMGLFVGKDFVNQSPNVAYKFNKKTWVAIQLGYEFTDYR